MGQNHQYTSIFKYAVYMRFIGCLESKTYLQMKMNPEENPYMRKKILSQRAYQRGK